jgi:hypothetical protein
MFAIILNILIGVLSYGWLGCYLKVQCMHLFHQNLTKYMWKLFTSIHLKALRKSPVTPKLSENVKKTFEFPSPTSIWNSENIIFWGSSFFEGLIYFQYEVRLLCLCEVQTMEESLNCEGHFHDQYSNVG